MKRFVAILSILILLTSGALSKCANRSINISGRVVGPHDGSLKIAIEVVPDPNWEPQPDTALKDDEFVSEMYFNTTKAEGRVRDNCSRVPKSVDVVLSRDGHEVDRVRLDISRDFVKNKGGYELRSPIILHSRQKAQER